jgi:hypothetical protein
MIPMAHPGLKPCAITYAKFCTLLYRLAGLIEMEPITWE